MPTATRTFRVFVSSTFEDLKDERNALAAPGGPFAELTKLCQSFGARFQAIDLRWGVREEAGLDQRTMEICLGEIERCQRTGIKPNFIVLLGDRYGWRPLPARIEAEEFRAVRDRITDEEDRARVDNWYRLDENAVPPEYLLRPRTGEFKDIHRWGDVEIPMHKALREAARAAGLSGDSLIKYEASATHQEILKGLGKTAEDREHVFAFLCKPSETNEDPGLAKLKQFLRDELSGNVFEPRGTAELCERVRENLERVIRTEAAAFKSRPALDIEVDAQDTFARDRARHFMGRSDVLDAIDEYVKGPDRRPMVVDAASGSGKSALMARASEALLGPPGNAVVIRRFIGVTPESSSGITLLRSLCEEIGQRYGEAQDTPVDFHAVVSTFADRLALATPHRPLVLFIDALDQIAPSDPAAGVNWLKQELPLHCKVVLSTTSVARSLKGARHVGLGPLPTEDAKGALALWLHDAKRQLEDRQHQKVLAYFKRCGLPLYLRLAFEEARRWRSFEDADDCVLGEGLGGIIDALFDRLSSNANHGEILVSRALAYLAAAQYGLTEDEMVEVLTADDDVWGDFQRRARHDPPTRRLPQIVWSRLFLDIEPYFAERVVSGETVIMFYHRQLIDATVSRYLNNNAERSHLALAKLFDARADPTGDGSFSGPIRALLNLPRHLDGAGASEWAINRLKTLHGQNFTSQKLARTHDPSAIAVDNRYFFKAYLRGDDLSAALNLAASQSRLSGFVSLITTEEFGHLAPYLGATSPFWLEIQNVIASTASPTQRVTFLTQMLRPGLAPAMCAWLRFQFDQAHDEVSGDLRGEFLSALAQAEVGAIDYLRRHVGCCPCNETLTRNIIERIAPLCRGTNMLPADVVTTLADWVVSQEGSFATCADAFAENLPAHWAVQGLNELHKRHPQTIAFPNAIRCTAALSHAFLVAGIRPTAELLALQCFKQLPATPPADGAEQLLGSHAFADAAFRFTQASGPFATLWPEARKALDRVLKWTTEPIPRAEVLGSFLRATPWIENEVARSAFVQTTLQDISNLQSAEATRGGSVAFMKTFAGYDPLRQPIERGFLGLFARIDAVVSRAGRVDLRQLDELILSAAALSANVDDGTSAMVPFLAKTLPPLIKSRHPNVAAYAIKFFIAIIGSAELFSNQSGEVLEDLLAVLIISHGADDVLHILDSLLDDLEASWLKKNVATAGLVLCGILRATLAGLAAPKGAEPDGDTRKSQRYRILKHCDERLGRWHKQVPERFRDHTTVLWAGCLIALGHNAEGGRMLAAALAKSTDQMDDTLRLVAADALLKGGAGDGLEDLLKQFLIEDITSSNVAHSSSQLKAARRVLSANGPSAGRARQLFLSAARSGSNNLDDSATTTMLLNRVFDIGDTELAVRFLDIAQKGLLTEIHQPFGPVPFDTLWFVALSLSSLGQLKPALQLWERLRDEQRDVRPALLRRSLMHVMAPPTANALTEVDELFRLLGQLDPARQPEALVECTRALAGAGLSAEILIRMLATDADANDIDARVFEAICAQLKYISDRNVAQPVLEHVVAQTGSIRVSALKVIIRLCNEDTDVDGVHRSLEVLIDTAGKLAPSLLSQCMEVSLTRLSPTRAAELLIATVDVINRVVSSREKDEIWAEIAAVACRAYCGSAIDSILESLVGHLGGRAGRTASNPLLLAQLYRALADRSAPPALCSRLARLVESIGYPDDVAGQVEWLACLVGTPAEPLTYGLRERFHSHPELVWGGPQRRYSLATYLRVVTSTWSEHQARERFTDLAEWVAGMPLITNEDWRPYVFEDLFRAATLAAESVREDRELLVLEAANGALNAEQALPNPIVSNAGSGTIRRYLELEAARRGGGREAKYACILTSICAFSADELVDRTADTLARLMDEFMDLECPLSRSKLAEAALKCSVAVLSRRLDSILQKLYDREGFASLDGHDLMYLAGRPEQWWIEQAAVIDIAPDVGRWDLLRWVRRYDQLHDRSCSLSVGLSVQWLSEHRPEDLREFVFDVATESPLLPDRVRSSAIHFATRG